MYGYINLNAVICFTKRKRYGNCIMFPADALEDGKTPVFTSNNTEIESQDETLSKIA